VSPSPLNAVALLDLMPQAQPFRFIDRVLEVDRAHIVASYRFREDASFYAGHFPGAPITPGVIVLEAMAQCGLALHGIYLLALEVAPQELAAYRTMFTNADIEWCSAVYPGDSIVIKSDVVAWRRRRLRVRVEARNQKGEIVATGEIAGIGVRI
jgi:3-hydroxyacyl-[acyl-carrier-protein] dehydratase